MKKQIIMLLLLSTQLQSYCQKSFILSSGECNDSVLMSIKGKYRQQGDNITADISSILSRGQQQEVLHRLEAVHKLLQEAYPQPTGVEGNWWRNTGSYLFAHNNNFTKGIPTCSYSYYCAFGPYNCTPNQPKEVNYIRITGTVFKVNANEWADLQNDMMMDTSMTINGLPFFMLNPVKETWKGYGLIHSSGESRTVLLTRHGELPYIPVTRKQYLDYCIRSFNKSFDDMIKSSKEMPFSTQQQKDETTNKIIKQKNEVIKRYEKELEKNSTDNLLDSPAIVRILQSMYPDVPIFTTGTEDGKMLAIENRAYIRKDLPKYVPQFLILYWSWNEDVKGTYFRRMLEANFPIEKLQAMIDK